MRTATNRTEIRNEQGFAVHVLRSEKLELAVVPELGAKIISLRNLRTGREWMWHPEGGLKLFRNQLGDDFSRSALGGADECLPTVAPCSCQGRELPDHGEAWSVAWKVHQQAWEAAVLKTSLALARSPLEFERTIEVQGEHVRLSYRLRNRGAADEKYLWAFHPLFQVQAGDRLSLPPSTRALFNGEAWIDAVDSAVPKGGCAKLFAGPLKEGAAGICNQQSGDQLLLRWDPGQNNTLGLWLTRGGWHGHHHLALEPTNGAPDPLAAAAAQQNCGMVPASGSQSWSLDLQLKP